MLKLPLVFSPQNPEEVLFLDPIPLVTRLAVTFRVAKVASMTLSSETLFITKNPHTLNIGNVLRPAGNKFSDLQVA